MAAQITPLPSVPSRQDPTNFNDRADAFLGALPTFQSEANALSTEVNTRADSVQASYNAVMSATNITKWESGFIYATGAVVWSPINGLGYRRITASGSGNTDPSSDSTNYRQVNGTGNVSTDVNGNLGLGVTPSAWSGFKAFDIGTLGSVASLSTQQQIGLNYYWNGNSYIYKSTNTASYYNQNSGSHAWFTAPSGTAGNPISFTQAMTLGADGVLQVPNGVSASLKPALNGGIIWPDDPLGGTLDTASIKLESAGGEAMSMAFRLTNDEEDKFQFFSSGTGTYNNNMLLNGNIILNAANYNDYSPTKTGGGASGTWGINVSGTASKLTTASGTAPSYSARAWVNFNGIGTVSIRASGNVSSITDNGVGAYRVNFTTEMSNANYSVSGVGGLDPFVAGGIIIPTDQINTSYGFIIRDTGNIVKDGSLISIVVFA